MNDQQYITYQMERKLEFDNTETKWIEMSTDVQCRTEIIKAKIKDLAPDLFMKSVSDTLFIKLCIGHWLQLYWQKDSEGGKETIGKKLNDR